MSKYSWILLIFTVVFVLKCDGERISKQMCQEYIKSLESRQCLPGEDLIKCKEKVTYDCKYQYTGLVVGGEDVLVGEFPHMAAIGWRNLNEELEFLCGGSLISDKFVLTAAHCEFKNRKSPVIVRLGEHDVSTKNDGAEHVDYDIEQFIKHPSYDKSSKINDIALIELKDKVTFNTFIRPACLKQEDDEAERVKVLAIGWEKYNINKNQSVLQKTKLFTISNDECEDHYNEDDQKVTISPSQICAAGSPKKIADACEVVSGGPLQMPHKSSVCISEIVGLTFNSTIECGSGPVVYTRVSSHLNWIESVVWPYAKPTTGPPAPGQPVTLSPAPAQTSAEQPER